MDKQIALLIKNLNQGMKMLPSGVKTMVHQYVVTGYIFAGIFLSLTIIGVLVAYKSYSDGMKNIANANKNSDGIRYSDMGWFDIQPEKVFIIWGSIALSVFNFTMFTIHLEHAINPIVNLISDFK